LTVSGVHKVLKITIFISLHLFVSASLSWAGQYRLSGFVKDSLSGESLPGVHIFLPEKSTGATTNNYGFYSILLSEGEHRLEVSYVGYRTQSIVVLMESNKRLDINLSSGFDLELVEVEADQYSVNIPTLGTISMPIKQITNTPALLGERDILKVFQLMPGVQRGNEGTGGLFVRGGGYDQNLIILDDAIVYNASHLFGFFSLFNGDAIKDVKLIKGGFPARYGGRLSSVMDITMRDGDLRRYRGEIGIGLISSRFTAEGPVIYDRASFLISGRRTYLDQIFTPLMPDEEKIGYYFYDWNTKFNYKFNDNNRAYLSGFFGEDNLNTRYSEPGQQNKNGIKWNNALVSLRIASVFPNGVFINNTLLFSQYRTGFFYENINTIDSKKYALDYFTGIRDYSAKSDMIFNPFPYHTVRFGGIGIFHNFSPGSFEITNEFVNESRSQRPRERTFEGALYVENEYIKNRLMYNLGLRLSYYNAASLNKVKPEPRITIGYKLTERNSVKAAFSNMNQYIHLLSNTAGALPTDLWLPASSDLIAQNSNQYSFGWHFLSGWHDLEFSFETYYKKSENVLTYRDGANFFFIDDQNPSADINWKENVTSGQSLSYGFEFLLHKRSGRVNGWLAYTWSKADAKFNEINNGDKFPANFDRRHDFALTLNYEHSERINFSMSWVYMTGYPITLPYHTAGVFRPHNFEGSPGLFQSGSVDYFQNRNNFRTDNYHRLDINVSFTKPRKNGVRIWEVGVYNAYNKMNPFSYNMVTDRTTNRRVLKKTTIFPLIPSVTYVRRF